MALDEQSRVTLVQEIETAFSKVTLCQGIGLYEASAIDDYANKDEQRKARRKDERGDWRKISDEEIEHHFTALCFVDTAGFRFLLPAFMRYTIRNYDTSTSISVDSTIFALDGGWVTAPRFVESLTKQQKEVIAKFLRQMVLEVGDDWVDTVMASRAYENYWQGHDTAL